jgi:hypothetical protein
MPDHERIASYFTAVLEAALDQPHPTTELHSALETYLRLANAPRPKLELSIVLNAALDQPNPSRELAMALNKYMNAIDHRCRPGKCALPMAARKRERKALPADDSNDSLKSA